MKRYSVQFHAQRNVSIAVGHADTFEQAKAILATRRISPFPCHIWDNVEQKRVQTEGAR